MSVHIQNGSVKPMAIALSLYSNSILCRADGEWSTSGSRIFEQGLPHTRATRTVSWYYFSYCKSISVEESYLTTGDPQYRHKRKDMLNYKSSWNGLIREFARKIRFKFSPRKSWRAIYVKKEELCDSAILQSNYNNILKYVFC